MTQPSDAAAAGQNHFNLLEKPWIPVIFLNGEFKRLSITEAFQQAHQIRDIASPNPMDRVAVVRFLLALLYWGQGNPPPLPPPTPDTPLDVAALLAKLQNHRQYFKLLGDKPRFYQTCDADRKTKIAELIQEIPSGNNFWHFRHVTDKQHGFCPACCALGLLRLPLFAVSGLPNLRAGINGTPPIYVIHHGQTLADTLRQNWLPTSSTSLGTPAWVDPLVRPSAQGAVPLLVGLTTLARKVWLLDDNTQGICSLCGRPCGLSAKGQSAERGEST
jgi:CRISPR system Cascade subunit CasA